MIAAAITSQMTKTHLPTHIDVVAQSCGLCRDSVILLEQIRTIDKRRLREKTGHVDDALMMKVNDALSVSFGLGGVKFAESNPAEATPASSIPDGDGVMA